MTAVAKISPKGQVVIPAEIRRTLDVKEGDKIVFEVTHDGRVEVKGLPSFTYETIIGSLPFPGELPSIEVLREQAYRERTVRFLDEGLMNQNDHT